MTIDITQYTSLITSEHNQKPKFMAMVSLLAQWAVDRQNLLQSIRGTEAVPGAVTLDVVPSADAVFYRTDWQGTQLLYATPRTNQFLQSTNLASGSWTRSNIASVVAATGPDGSSNAYTVTTGSSGLGFIYQTLALTLGVPVTVSTFAQAGSTSSFRIVSTTQAGAATFTLTGSGSTSAVSGVFSNAVIVPIGGGWYYCAVTLTPTAMGSNIIVPADITTGSSSVTFFGPQHGAAGSYIPSTTTAVTVTDYAISVSGMVSLGQTPVSGAPVTWSGDATVLENGGPVQASNALLGTGNGSTKQFQAALTWGSQLGTPEAPGIFDVDVAVGQQLDWTGLWIGATRNLEVPLTDVYFSFDEAGLGFDQGAWLGPFDPTSGLVSLPDEAFRTLLYAVIAANTWDGTVPGAYAAWGTVFEPLGYEILIQDNQDMTMAIGLIGPAPDAVTLALFTGGYLNLIPGGVGVNFYFTQSVSGIPIFGFDAENSSISGFDVGAWAVPVA